MSLLLMPLIAPWLKVSMDCGATECHFTIIGRDVHRQKIMPPLPIFTLAAA